MQSSKSLTELLQFMLEGPPPCTLFFNVHTTADYLNPNISIGQLLQHISNFVVCARPRPKTLTKVSSKEVCRASQLQNTVATRLLIWPRSHVAKRDSYMFLSCSTLPRSQLCRGQSIQVVEYSAVTPVGLYNHCL